MDNGLELPDNHMRRPPPLGTNNPGLSSISQEQEPETTELLAPDKRVKLRLKDADSNVIFGAKIQIQ